MNAIEFDVLERFVTNLPELIDLRVSLDKGARPGDDNIIIKTGNETRHFFPLLESDPGIYSSTPFFKNFRNGLNRILVADSISSKSREFLRDRNISYIDSGGNVFFPAGRDFFWVEENKQMLHKAKEGQLPDGILYPATDDTEGVVEEAGRKLAVSTFLRARKKKNRLHPFIENLLPKTFQKVYYDFSVGAYVIILTWAFALIIGTGYLISYLIYDYL